MFCEDFFFFLLAKRDVENSELVCSMLRSSIDGDVRIFPRDLYRSYGWPVAPEPAYLSLITALSGGICNLAA